MIELKTAEEEKWVLLQSRIRRKIVYYWFFSFEEIGFFKLIFIYFINIYIHVIIKFSITRAKQSFCISLLHIPTRV